MHVRLLCLCVLQDMHGWGRRKLQAAVRAALDRPLCPSSTVIAMLSYLG